MKLEEKIVSLRKRNGWSQEELGFRLDVSRQAVSKWEMGDCMPDLDKIIKMSEVFGCTTDYLLKDEETASFPKGEALEEKEAKNACVETVGERESEISHRQVCDEEGNEYLKTVEKSSWKIAVGVTLCILSPVVMFVLLACSLFGMAIAEEVSVGIGVVTLIAICAVGVVCILFGGIPLAEYEYLENEILVVSERLKASVEGCKRMESRRFAVAMTTGVALCILSVLPLLIIVFCFPTHEWLIMLSVAFILVVVSIAVFLFVKYGMVKLSYQKLLQEGDYTVRAKRERKGRAVRILYSVYWPLIVVLYLVVSFLTERWDRSWLIWPIAAATYAILSQIVAILSKDKGQMEG